MRKKFLKLLFESKNETHIVKNKSGETIFVGTFRQLRRRLQAQFGAGKTEDVLQYLEEYGYKLSPFSPADYTIYMKTEKRSELKLKISQIPRQPGVYQFIGKGGEVLYVGKAKNLKARVSQYFGSGDIRPQLPYLLQDTQDISYTVVTNELESLFLENTLIKKFLPKYNIQLRDDKNYAFITIDYASQIPQVSFARRFDRDNKHIRYFGPYSAAWKIRNTLHLIRRIFPYCANTEVGTRPCFYYYLHRCPGVCIGKISLAEYNDQLERICEFLSGSAAKLRKELRTSMQQASAAKQFERAARLRDQLQALALLEEKQNVILPRPVSWDVVSAASESGYVCINLFRVREGKLADKENFVYETSNPHSDAAGAEGSAMQAFLEQYYLETNFLPKQIYIQTEIEDPEIVEHIVRSRYGRKAAVSVPKKGKPQELAKLGETNAAEYLKNWLSSQAGHLDKINTALEELKRQLNLEKIPDRIECYDISNIQGTNAVGSMVVFEKGLPKKSEYRKFRIKYNPPAGGPDDFAMMREMLSRRFAHSVIARSRNKNSTSGDEATLSSDKRLPRPSDALGARNDRNGWPLPDLIVIDGGKGQLSAALEVLQPTTYHLSPIPVIGLAKRIEEIFFPGISEPLMLPHDNPGLQLLQRLRDETHRFGITFHRDLRSNQAVRSALDSIPGIGPKTKKLLKEKFGTVAQIRKTPFEELAKVVGERMAQVILRNL